MLAFNNDYSHGAHPAVLQALVDTNMEPQPGYGTDAHTERAKQLIRVFLSISSKSVIRSCPHP